MTQAWSGLWLALAFLAELAALAALAYAGWQIPAGLGLRVVVAVAAPALAALLWGVFAAPRAPVRAPALELVVKVVVFGSAALALAATGHALLALALAVVATLSAVLADPPDAVSRPAR